MKGTFIGEFEELVLLSIAILEDNAYGVAIKEEIKKKAKRNPSIGALHSAFKRLEEKGFIKSHLGEQTPERGGRTTMTDKPYEDIPGTFVFDADRSREGYHLNQFCISLRLQVNRDAFNADEDAYLDRYPMSAEQRDAVKNREWNRMLELGGNIYYTSKLAANDGINFQDLAGIMTGMGRDAYREMMLSGGRTIEGNRYKSEWEDK